MSENKQPYQGFVGPSNTQRVGRYDCERTVNMYLEQSSGGTPKGQQQEVLVSTPGLKFLQNLSGGPIRAIHITSNKPTLYVVAGQNVWMLTSPTATPVLIGTLLTAFGYVSVADNGLQVVFVDGQYGYYSEMVGPVLLTLIIVPNFYPATQVTFQDGYFIFAQTDSIYMFISDLYSVNFLALNQAGKTGNSDNLVGLISNNRELYMFGQYTTEIWWDAGQSGSTPFIRQDGKFSQIGCLAPASIAKLNNTVMWLGANPEGGAVVYMLSNDYPARISNHAVEFSLQSLGGDYSGVTAYTWQVEGHYFYVLNAPGLNTTWVFDLTTLQWFEQQSLIKGVIGRHLAQYHAFFDGIHVVGDYTTGNLYSYDYDTFTDNGNAIARIRQAPHLSLNLNRLFYKMLEVDFTPGTSYLVNGANVNPRITLEISNDGGFTFSNPIFAALGNMGNYYARARWQRLGTSRDRVFKVSCSDPVKFSLLSAMIDVEVGNA
jgi:hypothetical protein